MQSIMYRISNMQSAHSWRSLSLRGVFNSSSDGRHFISSVSICFSNLSVSGRSVFFIVVSPGPGAVEVIHPWGRVIVQLGQGQACTSFNNSFVVIHGCEKVFRRGVQYRRYQRAPLFCHIDRLYARLRIFAHQEPSLFRTPDNWRVTNLSSHHTRAFHGQCRF